MLHVAVNRGRSRAGLWGRMLFVAVAAANTPNLEPSDVPAVGNWPGPSGPWPGAAVYPTLPSPEPCWQPSVL
jgi:hypothetical protein